LNLEYNLQLQKAFPDLVILPCLITDVRVEKQNDELRGFSQQVIKQILEQYDLSSLANIQTVRAYRNFFWKVGIDPTKSRPAAEALIRRALRKRALPKINSLVDAYNLASVQTEIAFAAFDGDKLRGNLLVRFAEKGEKMLGIGMEKPIVLRGGEIVISDMNELIAIYPHRDSEETKITGDTRNCMLLACGVPSIGKEELQRALDLATKNIMRFCGGNYELQNDSSIPPRAFR
jgi:DNA/RNA-binding domain of Phe-tRNA-synthetase-like protein